MCVTLSVWVCCWHEFLFVGWECGMSTVGSSGDHLAVVPAQGIDAEDMCFSIGQFWDAHDIPSMFMDVVDAGMLGVH